MKYYKNGWSWSQEISQQRYYTLKRRKDATTAIAINNGQVVAMRVNTTKP